MVGDIAQLKPALRLMMAYRLVIEEGAGAEVVTSYTRWLECVQVKGSPEQEVYGTFSPRFERIWLESRKRLPEFMERKPANAGLRSRYALRLHSWAMKYVDDEAKTVSLEELRKVFCLESVKDAAGIVIREAPLSLWSNFQQRALNLAMAQINKRTDLKIELSSVQRSSYRRVVSLNFTIKARAIPKGVAPSK